MTITEAVGKGKKAVLGNTWDFLLIGIVILVASLCFGLGILVGKELERERLSEIHIEYPDAPLLEPSTPKEPQSTLPTPQPAAVIVAPAVQNQTGTYVASKSGTKYYLPTCGTAKRIKPENQVWFATKDEAAAAGYEPGANCPGL